MRCGWTVVACCVRLNAATHEWSWEHSAKGSARKGQVGRVVGQLWHLQLPSKQQATTTSAPAALTLRKGQVQHVGDVIL